MKRTIAQIYKAYKAGSTLTTPELVRGRDHLSQLAKFAMQAGPEFHLAGQEANRVSMDLDSFIDARNRKW